MQKEWETMNKAADRTYLWNDRSCIDDSLSPWRPTSVTTPIGRLAHMAQAYATPASKFYKNDSLKKDVIDGPPPAPSNRVARLESRYLGAAASRLQLPKY